MYTYIYVLKLQAVDCQAMRIFKGGGGSNLLLWNIVESIKHFTTKEQTQNAQLLLTI